MRPRAERSRSARARGGEAELGNRKSDLAGTQNSVGEGLAASAARACRQKRPIAPTAGPPTTKPSHPPKAAPKPISSQPSVSGIRECNPGSKSSYDPKPPSRGGRGPVAALAPLNSRLLLPLLGPRQKHFHVFGIITVDHHVEIGLIELLYRKYVLFLLKGQQHPSQPADLRTAEALFRNVQAGAGQVAGPFLSFSAQTTRSRG